jgi:hypothetical protein
MAMCVRFRTATNPRTVRYAAVPLYFFHIAGLPDRFHDQEGQQFEKS